MPNLLIQGGDIAEAEVAAALAAVVLLLQSSPLPAPEPANRWRDSRRLLAQGMAATRVRVAPRWNTIERLRRDARAGSGVVGF